MINHLKKYAFLALIAGHTLSGPASAQETSADFSGGSIQLGHDTSTCDSTLEGAIRSHIGANAPTSGLIGYWTLDENSGTTANDSTANNNDGILSGGLSANTDSVSGKVSRALNFNGTSDYVDLGNPALFQITGSISIAAWIRGENFSEIKHFISKQGNGAGSSNYGWRLATSGGSDTFVMGVSETGATMIDRESTTIPSLNTWYHVVGVYDAAAQTIDIYVNGALDNGTLSGTVPASQNDSSMNVNIGRRSEANRYFDGDIDDVRIYNRPLSALEVANIYETSLEFCNGSSWTKLGQ